MGGVNEGRRHALLAGAGACLFLPAAAFAAEKKGNKAGDEKEVGAVEDLMREHGVLRRALLVYIESVPKLRHNPSTLDATALNETAKLFRAFGEDYHEKKLEEAYIFPTLKKSRGSAAAEVDTLIRQHNRGREITDYVINVTRTGKLQDGDIQSLARVLTAFVRMYQNHAAREDTVIFPAWKTAISAQQLDELGDKFEEIEQQQFGTDGFEEAVKQIAGIEQRLGFADLARFTPPPPPKVG